MSEIETTILYILIFAISTLFMYLAQKYARAENGQRKQIFNIFWFLMAAIPLWIISCFTDIGADYESYSDIIRLSANLIESNGPIEIGFNGLCYALYSIFRNTDIVIFILKSFTLALYFYALYIIRKEAILYIALLSFLLLRFLEFYLISMQLSVALFLVSIISLSHNKILKFWIFYILSCSVHSSAIIIFVPLIMLFIFKGRTTLLPRKDILILILGSVVVMALWLKITTFAISNILFFEQYGTYSIEGSSQGSGLMQYVYYLPIFITLFFQYKYNKWNFIDINIFIIFSIFFFLMALMGYKIAILARMSAYALLIYFYFIPKHLYFQQNIPNMVMQLNTKRFVRIELLFWIFFIGFRGIIWLNDKLSSSTSLVNEWHFFNPL